MDGSQTNREAILSCDTTNRLQNHADRRLKPIRIRQSQYLNNRIEQDHRAIKRRVRPMLGFKTIDCARVILGGIEMIHMMRKRQARLPSTLAPPSPSSSRSSQRELSAIPQAVLLTQIPSLRQNRRSRASV